MRSAGDSAIEDEVQKLHDRCGRNCAGTWGENERTYCGRPYGRPETNVVRVAENRSAARGGQWDMRANGMRCAEQRGEPDLMAKGRTLARAVRALTATARFIENRPFPKVNKEGNGGHHLKDQFSGARFLHQKKVGTAR